MSSLPNTLPGQDDPFDELGAAYGRRRLFTLLGGGALAAVASGTVLGRWSGVGASTRWPHVHFEVYPSLEDAVAGTNRLATSQLAFPQADCEAVYATDGYADSVDNLARLSLETDGVFRDDAAASQLAAMSGDVTAGYVARLAVGV